MVVSAATGAVGSLVGQIAKLKGCRVVGVAGAEAKCRYAIDTLGLDACVSHRDDDLAGALKDACPDGIVRRPGAPLRRGRQSRTEGSGIGNTTPGASLHA